MRKYTDFFLLFFLIVFTSGASTISNDDVIFSLLYVFSHLVIYFRNGIVFNKTHGYLYAGFAFFAGLYFLLNGAIDMFPWVGFFLRIIYAYNLIYLLGKTFPDKFMKMARTIATISIVFFGVQLIAPDFLFSANNLFGVSSRQNSNSLIFNFSQFHMTRNSGCMWEPGVYASFLIISLCLSELYNLELISKRNLPLLIALLTTVSTTGYLGFGILAYMHYNQNKSLRVFSWIIVILIVAAIFSLDFVGDKIQEQYLGLSDEMQRIDQVGSSYGDLSSISRFASFVVDFKAFSQRPILGYGADVLTTSKAVYYSEYGDNINRVSGIMAELIRFGVVGFLLHVILQYRSFKSISSSTRAVLSTIIFLTIIFASTIGMTPLLFLLLFLKKTK